MGCAAGLLLLCRWRSTFSAPCLSCISGDRTTTDLPRSAYHRPEYVGGQCHCDCRRVLIARQQGSPLLGAINYVLRRSALPLLGATIIAILAFAPIGLSQDSTGEYCKSLFQVLLISLMLSWFSALTITPVLIKWWLFKTPRRPPPRRKRPILTAAALPWLSAGAANTAAAKDPDPGADGRAVSRSDLGLYLCSAEFFSVIEYAYILCRPVATLRYRYKRHGEDDPGYRAVDSRSAGVVTTVSTIGRAVCVSFSPTAGSASTATTRRLWCGWMINAASPLSPATSRTGLPETTRRLTPAPNALCSGPPG